MADGRGREGDRRTYARGQSGLGQAHGADGADQVIKAQRFRNIAEVCEQFYPVGQIPQTLGLTGRNAGGEKIPGLSRLVEKCEHTAAGAGQRAGRGVWTTAHLNYDPSDNRDENLKALCQACHNRYDAAKRTQNRKVPALGPGEGWAVTDGWDCLRRQ